MSIPNKSFSAWDRAKRKEWEANAPFWISIIREELDPFRAHVTHRAILESLPKRKGLKILDAACGEGYLARMIARLKMRVWGIDFSQTLIQAAHEEEDTRPLNIRYAARDMRETNLPSSFFDIVVSHHGINELENPGQALKEFARVLKKRGRIVLLFLHPCFDFPITLDGKTVSQHYFRKEKVERPRYLVWGRESPEPYFYLHLPLSEWALIIREAGFDLKDIREPQPTPRRMRQQWWKENFSRPRFILLIAEKA